MPDKSSLRRHFLALRQQIPAYRQAEAANAIKTHLLALISPDACVAGYAAMRGEPDVFPALHAMRARGNPVALPCVQEKGQPLVFRRYDARVPLSAGHYGVSCPAEDAEALVPEMVLVPLLAFDHARHRLGYGGGYYDRTLAQLKARNPQMEAIGIAYACQQVDALTPEAHDVPLDMIVTESGIIR